MLLEISQMKKIRSAAPLFVALLLGALVASCMSFSSGSAGGSGGSPGIDASGSGGFNTGGSTGSGGTSATGGSTGSGGTVGTGGTPGTGGSPCASGTLQCSGTCITPTTDNANCGSCGNACSSDKTCQSGSCACTTGRVQCTGSTTCIDTTSDSANCGGCGKACATGQVCSDGSCATTCATGTSACSGACVNLQTDIDHCGTCTTACSAANNQTCTAGACVCVSGQTSCSGTCKNLQTDAANCGTCGKACATGQTCTAGACACASGQTSCSGTCKNLQTDTANCGACGTACASGQTCTAGACVCASGQTSCSGTCKNLQTDAANCGTCGKACASGQTCTAGVCAGGTGTGPCDILGAAGNPCVAAHSTVRALYGAYTGNLYQVCKGSFAAGPNSCKGTTMDIGVVTGGYANAMAQDMFCTGGSCTISIIYDQSPNGNHLKPTPSGGGAVASADNPASATALPTTLNGNKVYGVYINTGMGYRAGCTGCGVAKATGTATGDQAETEYMVTSQNGKQNGNSEGCCFDYGNAETDLHDDGAGTMEAVYFGGGVAWGTGSPGSRTSGPWVMADLENGIFAGWQNSQNQNISTNTPLKDNFVTGIVIGDSCTGKTGCAGTGSGAPNGRFALYGGNAQSGPLTTEWDGVRPTGYFPMKKQGSIILGTGGDNSDSGTGQWFEGVMASGAATLTTATAVQANIVAAGYGK